MDVWQLAILTTAAVVVLRSLLSMTIDHQRRYRRRRVKEIAAERAREAAEQAERTDRESVAA